MASLSVRRLDGEVVRRLKMRAQRDGLSVEETVRRILANADRSTWSRPAR